MKDNISKSELKLHLERYIDDLKSNINHINEAIKRVERTLELLEAEEDILFSITNGLID